MGPLHNKQALLFIHFIVCQATIWYTPDFHWWKAIFPRAKINSKMYLIENKEVILLCKLNR